MNNSKTRQIIRFLGTGKDLTTSQIQRQFGISNVSATMSRVRSVVEQYGNWRMVSNPLKNGNGQRFSMKRVVLANPMIDVDQVESALA
jgi:hypothetical protein|tara:strand:+ start:316 stop:579 length:264 start_codon:yes stop_codon:yes gene_type:complete